MSRVDQWCRDQVVARLERLRHGELHVRDCTQETVFGASGSLNATLNVHRPRFYRRVVSGGSLGVAEAYMDGDWSTDSLPRLLQLLARNGSISREFEQGWLRIHRPLDRCWGWFRRNTRPGSRRNIAAHYDLSNEFYRLWLDETLSYSAGMFPDEQASLRDASLHKFDVTCQKLQLQPEDHLLEIGSGWGGLALHAAERYGCRVTTTTISRQQYLYVQRQIAERGLADRVTLLDSDYRDLDGSFDKLVSIEMVEAVGHEYLTRFFAKCGELLRPGGRFALQAITIPEQRYGRYRQSIDFIQRYIFPGGALPSVSAIQNAVGQQSDLLLVHLQDFAGDYARTLSLWRERFLGELASVRQLGFDDRFIRMWDYYLSYCAAGFRERQIGVAQLVFEKQV